MPTKYLFVKCFRLNNNYFLKIMGDIEALVSFYESLCYVLTNYRF